MAQALWASRLYQNTASGASDRHSFILSRDIAAPCRHPGHVGGATHIDQDAFLDLMCWCRQRVRPDGIIMTHLSGYPQIVIENMSDIALIYEDQGGVDPVNPECFPIQCAFMPITPRHLCGWGTDNEQSRCAMVCLLQGHPPLPLPAAMYDGKGGTENLYGKFSQFAGMDLSRCICHIWSW
jgi:hypothetical protein